MKKEIKRLIFSFAKVKDQNDICYSDTGSSVMVEHGTVKIIEIPGLGVQISPT